MTEKTKKETELEEALMLLNKENQALHEEIINVRTQLATAQETTLLQNKVIINRSTEVKELLKRMGLWVAS